MIRLLLLTGVVLGFGGFTGAQEQPFRFAGAACAAPPVLHCPDKDCPSDRVINQGPVVEMKTRRTYFLDYPCDLKPGEKVTFILSLHGGGSYGNWQRNYFPIMDFKDKHRLVIATPNAPTRAWSAPDDEYLHNIVDFVVSQIGRENIKAFWLAGHSQGGMTSNRIIRTEFFKDKVDGWLSLSGGRLGGNTGRPAGPGPEFAAAAALLNELPANDFSFIYETGQREIDEKGVPAASAWAAKYGCGPRRQPKEIADTKAGYVYDGSRQNPPNPAWGLLPAPGRAHVMAYDNCKDGRVVADVVRIDKGHTEGLEPNITEELVLMMLSAKGGKLLASSVSGQAPKGRPLTIEDYYRIKTVGDTQISPNGKWVAFALSTRIEDDNTTSIETYVVGTEGAAQPRRITHGGASVAAPRWTDDNLLSYSLNARVASSVFIGAGGPAAAPRANGDRWKVAVDSPNAAPQPATDFEKRHAARFKGKTFDWMHFQQDGQEFPTPDPRLRPAAEITITAVDGGATNQVTKLGFRPASLAWHPNGSVIAFTADENWKNEQGFEHPDIYAVTTAGNVSRLTTDGYVWSSLAYSPDGQFLLSERTFGTEMIIQQKLNHGGSDDLLLWPFDSAQGKPAAGGAAINLTATWDLEPNAPRWSPDGRHVYFTAEKGGTTHLFRVAPRAGAPIEQVTQGDRRINSLTFDKAMTKIAYTVGTYDSPSEVWTASIDGTSERQLTNMSADIRDSIGITKTERLSWKSTDGTAIEGWLTQPHGYDRAKGPYPLVVFNHGGPHSAVGYGFNFKQQYFAANGYFVFDTNFRSSTGYGDAFKWGTWAAWGTKDGQDVISGIDHVLTNYPVDGKKIAVMGHSYGGFMTNWLITQYPDRFAAAAAGAGISNWLSDYGTADIYRTKETEFFGTPWEEGAIARMVAQSPLMHAGKVQTPTLFIQGEADQRVPYEEAEQMYFAIRRQGVPAKMIQYAGQPHGISGHWNNVHRMLNELKWFDTYIQKAPATSTSARQ